MLVERLDRKGQSGWTDAQAVPVVDFVPDPIGCERVTGVCCSTTRREIRKAPEQNGSDRNAPVPIRVLLV